MKRRTYFIYLLIAMGIILITFQYSKKTIKENVEFKKNLERLMDLNDKNMILDFKNITYFDWDRLYIITPYTNMENFFKETNVNKSNIKTTINIHDNINLLVFIKHNEIVSYIELDRKYGDFALKRHTFIERQYSKFKYDNSKEEWVNINN